jgi:hypothetical protein
MAIAGRNEMPNWIRALPTQKQRDGAMALRSAAFDVQAEVEDKEAKLRQEWKRNLSAVWFDSPNLRYGMKFKHQGTTYTVIGRNKRSNKLPIMCESGDQIFSFSVDIAKKAK